MPVSHIAQQRCNSSKQQIQPQFISLRQMQPDQFELQISEKIAITRASGIIRKRGFFGNISLKFLKY